MKFVSVQNYWVIKRPSVIISSKELTSKSKEALVELSTECSFRKVSETMSKHTAGVLSKSAIHDLLTEVSQKLSKRVGLSMMAKAFTDSRTFCHN